MRYVASSWLWCASFILLTASCQNGIEDAAAVSAWDLPTDLVARLPQLKTLKLPTNVNRVDWLSTSLLESLDIEGCPVRSLDGLPATLKILYAANTELTGLQGLPAGLTSADLRYSGVQSLAGLPVGLSALRIGGSAISSLELLPSKLERLEIEDSGIGRLGKLPDSIVHLAFAGGRLREVEVFPPNLQSLEIQQTDVAVLPPLPATLRTVKLLSKRKPIAVASLPPFLRAASHDGALFTLIPQQRFLHTLDLPRGPIVQPELPGSLTVLRINFGGTSDGTAAAFVWPPKLKHLALVNYSGAVFLPTSLTTLDVTDSQGVDFGALGSLTGLNLTGWDAIAWDSIPPALEDLDMSRTKAKLLDRLPRGVKRLSCTSSEFSSLPQLPPKLEYLDLEDSRDLGELGDLPDSLKVLRLGRTAVTDSELVNLPRDLEELDISNTQITSLEALRKLRRLKALTLHVGQVRSLKHLPATVNRLRFVDRVREFRRDGGHQG